MSVHRESGNSGVEEQLRDFMVDELLWDVPRQTLESNFSLLESELLDSLDMLRLVTFLEGRFGLQLQDDDLVPENFETIGRIVQMIEQRLQR